MSSGGADMVPVLFSSGSGPVDESAYPYHGREARPEAWVVEKEPEQWIKDYMQENEDKFFSADDDDPGFTEEDLRAEAEAELKKKQAMIEAGDYLLWYSGDDWTIPDTDGKSARMQPSSWVLKDTWSIPKLTVMSASADGESVCVPNEVGMAAMKQELLSGRAGIVGYYAEAYILPRERI